MFACNAKEFEPLLTQVAQALLQRELLIGTAESCTGGLLGALLTYLPGSSRYYAGGVNAYANSVKSRLLGVSEHDLQKFGAVSEPVAKAMAQGACSATGATIGISITGIAGPDGGTPQKPVGMVYVGFATPQQVMVERHVFPGPDRTNVRQQAAHLALTRILSYIEAL